VSGLYDTESPGTGKKSSQRVKRSTSMKRQRVKPDNEYGAVRGIDLLGVACTLNFDLLIFTVVCTHRVGLTTHTGRGGTLLPCSRFPSLKTQSGRWWAERTKWQGVEGGDEAGTAGTVSASMFFARK